MKRLGGDPDQFKTVDQRLEELERQLRARGGRVTPQRMAILRALLTADHPTIEQVFEQVRRQFATISLMTLYRTFALLKEMGDLLEVHSVGAVPHYDGHRTSPHPHLVCGLCGRVVDSPVLDVEGLVDGMTEEADGWQLTHELAIYGVCPECRAARTG